MSLSRRELMFALGSGGIGPLSSTAVSARGLEAVSADRWPGADDLAELAQPDPQEIRIDSNENPLGPSKRALEALAGMLGDSGRYPMNTRPAARELAAEIARVVGVKVENVVMGAGSSEILRNLERVYLSPTRHYVAGSPSYDKVERFAQQLGAEAKLIPLDGDLKLDLDGIARASKGAGLVFINNPNNPTATVHASAAINDLVGHIRKTSPDTAIVLDEAYHDYVTDPGYQTAVPLALAHPDVVVTRTLSKAHGMAGLRLGYAVGQAKTIERLRGYALTFNTNVLVVAAAVASLRDPGYIDSERARNAESRQFTMKFFQQAGYKPADSQGNFMFVDVRRPTRDFVAACRQDKVLVGRPFAPLDKTHVRISIGTIEEMRRATQVFAKVLGVTQTTASRG